MLITQGSLTRTALAGRVAAVTGAGRGIGYEAARALVWLGARVIVAEIDKNTGQAAARRICEEFGAASATFIQTDVGDERSVGRLAREAEQGLGQVDIVLNNATVFPLGAVKDVPIRDWDASYRVNLRGPVLLARAFLPGMLARNWGVFVCVPSSGAAPYMGPYEVFKTAQVELASTLDGELEGTDVIAFSIGPGLVRTPGAQAGIGKLAPLYGKTVEEFYAMSEEQAIPVEAAGAGFAAAIALAPRFRGQEIGAIQALAMAGIDLPGKNAAPAASPAADAEQALALCREVRTTLAEQADDWARRPLFERQWVIRDFRRNAGMPVEQWLDLLGRLETCLAAGDLPGAQAVKAPLGQLAAYYEHLLDVARGYLQREPEKLAESERALGAWHDTAARLAALVGA